MSRAWPLVPLGEVLTRSNETVAILPESDYREITVRLWGKGVVLRGIVSGAEIVGSRRFVAKAGQLILSRIDARNGAIGIVPAELGGAVVTNDFPLFDLNQDKLNTAFLGWLSKTPGFVELCKRASEGTTNRVRLQEERFLALEFPLPPLPEQRRIVARIEALSAKIAEAHGLRQKAVEEAEVLLRATVSSMDSGLRESRRLTTIQTLASSEKGSLRSGPFGSALLHSEFVPDGIPAIGIQDVQENEFALTRRWNVTPEKAEQLKRYTIKPHDILVTVMGTLGRACVVPDGVPYMVSTKHIWTITLDAKKAEPRWVSYWLNYARIVREELLGQRTGTAIPGLNGEKIRATTLPDIPLLDQRRIVVYLDGLQAKVDDLKKLQAETAAELDALLPSILDKAFKGEL